ncbi:MAG TPA: DUF3073 family protein [Acidimicrobiales bacterium]|nr:DUF3073 family protein [Actinomycetes bacterium]HVN51190.1 DUF3073 family protein [Acidimicrobiales bacterium]
MGRGRAKAKQTKVARDLKYNTGAMDLDRLRADLVGDRDNEVDPELLARYGDFADTDLADEDLTDEDLTDGELAGDDSEGGDRYAAGR